MSSTNFDQIVTDTSIEFQLYEDQMNRILVLILFTFFFTHNALANDCKPLFGDTSQSFYKALRDLGVLARLKIFTVNDGQKELFIILDTNLVSKSKFTFSQLLQAILKTNPDNINLSRRNFSPTQKELIVENLKVVANESALAIIDPYYIKADMKTFSQFGIFDTLKKENILAAEHSPTRYTQYKQDIKSKYETIKFLAYLDTLVGAAMAASGYIILDSTGDPTAAVPLITLTVGFVSYNLIKTPQKIEKVYVDTQYRATRELLLSIYDNSDRLVIVVPDYLQKEFEEILKKNRASIEL